MTATRYAGVDLGATNVRAVVGDDDGEVVGRARRATPQADGVTVTEAVRATLRAACSAADVDPTALGGVGIGSIGPLDTTTGTVVAPPNVPAERVELVGPIADLTGAPVHLRNDAVAGVLGERRFADAPENTVYLTLSSGVGAGACVDGHVLSGWRGNAAEVGHVVVDSDGALECGCGGAGHWEAYAGGKNLSRYARYLHEREGVGTALDLEDATPPELFAAAERGDPLAETLVERLGRWNALGVATLVHAYAPEVVSVGGAVALGNVTRVLDPIRERLSDLLAVEPPELRVTPLGEDAVVRGALALVLPDAGDSE